MTKGRLNRFVGEELVGRFDELALILLRIPILTKGLSLFIKKRLRDTGTLIGCDLRPLPCPVPMPFLVEKSPFPKWRRETNQPATTHGQHGTHGVIQGIRYA